MKISVKFGVFLICLGLLLTVVTSLTDWGWMMKAFATLVAISGAIIVVALRLKNGELHLLKQPLIGLLLMGGMVLAYFLFI